MFHHPCSIPYLLQRKHASSFTTLSLPHPVLILRPQPPETPPSTLFCIFSLLFCDSTFPPACKCSPGSQTLQCPSSTPVFPPATSLPSSLILFKAKLFKGGFLKSHSTLNSLCLSYLGNGSGEKRRALNCKILCPGYNPSLATFSTADHPLSIGHGPNRIQMAHTSLVAFPKPSHTSINSPFIHKGSCSILGPVTEKRATRNRASYMERVTIQEQGPVGEGKEPEKDTPQLTLLFPSKLLPALPISLNPTGIKKPRKPIAAL